MNVNTRKIAKGAGVVGMAVLMGMAQAAAIQAAEIERQKGMRTPRFSNDEDAWALKVTNEADEYFTLLSIDGEFFVSDSNKSGCKEMRRIELLNDDLVREFERVSSRRQYLTEFGQEFDLYLSSYKTREALLFRRENKHGEMVDTFLSGPWTATAICL